MELLEISDVERPVEAFLDEDAIWPSTIPPASYRSALQLHRVRVGQITIEPAEGSAPLHGPEDSDSYLSLVEGLDSKLLIHPPEALHPLPLSRPGWSSYSRFASDQEGLASPTMSGADSWQVKRHNLESSTPSVTLQRFADGMEVDVTGPKEELADFDSEITYSNVPQLLHSERHFRKARIEFAPYSGTSPLAFPVFLPLLRVHCPKRNGCSAVLTVATSESTTKTLSLEFPGLGLSGGQTLTVGYQRTYPAEAKCMQYGVSAELQLWFGRTLVNGEPISEGIRFVLAEPKRLTQTELVIPKTEDLCQQLEFDTNGEEIDRRQGGKDRKLTIDDTESVEMLRTGELTASLNISRANTKVGFGFTRDASLSWSITTSLAAGFRYTKLKTEQPLGYTEVCWRARAR